MSRIQELKELINYYDKKYYEEGISEISDNEYDRLYEEYQKLEKELKIDDINSPTKKIGAGKDSGSTTNLPKFIHKTPLLSIDKKSRELEDLKKFYEDCGGDGVEVIVEPKLDGITCNINYESGKLVNAATRGNGYIGDLITDNFMETDTICPKTVSSDIFEVRGEAVIPYDKFKAYLSNSYSNPRNAVAGLMRSKNPDDVKNKHIQVMFYDVGHENFSNKDIKKDSEYIDVLKGWGFQSVPTVLCKDWKSLSECVENNFNHMISSIDGFNVLTVDNYPEAVCDGLVIKINDLNLRKELGFSQKGPKWGFAYKFKPLQAKTVIEKVEWQVGKSGRLCPVAVFKPVSLGGTTITRATLNNYDYMSNIPIFEEDKINLNLTQKLEAGDVILVERSNDVIPRIVAKKYNYGNDWQCNCSEILEKERQVSETFNEPSVCPACGSKIIKEGALHFCVNPLCNAQLKGKIEHFVSRDAMNIVGLGSETIDLFLERGFISNLSDIYKLKNNESEILKLEGFKKRKVEKLFKSIENSRNVEFWRFIYSLSLPGIGKQSSKDLAQSFTSVDELLKASKEQLLKLENFADKTADELLNYFDNEDFIILVNELTKEISIKEMIKNSEKFKGKSFVITGTLKEPRSYYQEIIEQNGGKVSNSVSSKTYAVLIGTDAGSKEIKARELKNKGSEIIILENEEKILKFLLSN